MLRAFLLASFKANGTALSIAARRHATALAAPGPNDKMQPARRRQSSIVSFLVFLAFAA